MFSKKAKQRDLCPQVQIHLPEDRCVMAVNLITPKICLSVSVPGGSLEEFTGGGGKTLP